ncbi:MAG: hypothetical protein EHM20_12315 [Alphaproteobacteria bacterium]|nr:MAG: hypothetical protein EHM20_12315 [Alphaproteobacteria bacterium]
MKNVTIYLRSISSPEKIKLMLFDSNRNGAINDLVTIAAPGSTIVWKRDRSSGIRRILRIYSKTRKGNIFRNEPTRFWFSNIFTLKLSPNAEGEEAYSIDFLLCDKTRVTIDPVIKIPPP